jgi:hypothetical protein
MAEAPSGIDQYKELTPQERNLEFNRIYRSLPGTVHAHEEHINRLLRNMELWDHAVVNGETDSVSNHRDYTPDSELKRLKQEHEDIEESRSQSDQKKELLKNLTSLLDYCAGTNAFKENLIEMFGFLYDRGIDRSRPEYTVFEILRLEQLNNPGSGGIFDTSVEILEEAALNHTYLNTLRSHSVLEQVEGTRETVNDISELMGFEKTTDSFQEFIQRDNVKIKNWREQFKDRYGRLPNVT